MDHALLVFILLWSSGLRTVGNFPFSEEIDDFRLVEGSSKCSGSLEVKSYGWTFVDARNWDLQLANTVCKHLDCGTVVRASTGYKSYPWRVPLGCLKSESALRKCLKRSKRYTHLDRSLSLTCSDSVRLVNGTRLCSGTLVVKSNQSNQSWSPVCEDDFSQNDAEVVCRELDCGAPSVLQGALYRQMEDPTWTKEFQCAGNESALQDCRHSGSARTSCSSGKAVELTCSEPDTVRLVGGSSHCAGVLEVKRDMWWTEVEERSNWNLKTADVVCRHLGCGSAVSTRHTAGLETQKTSFRSTCLQSEFAVRECVRIQSDFSFSKFSLEVNCSESVRLVKGNSLCSGRLEVRSNQRWSPVCEDDFDQQNAEVVCRELGCGAPSALRGAPYEEAEAPTWTEGFQCVGNESALQDCRSSGSVRETCSHGKAVRLTCAGPDDVRLSGGSGRCDGTLEMEQHGEWRPVSDEDRGWDQKVASVACRQLRCGSAVFTKIKTEPKKPVWTLSQTCDPSHSALREYSTVTDERYKSPANVEVICSDFLAQPIISLSAHIGVLPVDEQQGLHVLTGSSFTIGCSVPPQFPGGSFQLISNALPSSQDSARLPAVNHSAHFLFAAADRTHQGDYRCVYHVHVFSQNFSSESQPLHLIVSASLMHLMLRLVVLVLAAVFSGAMLFYCFWGATESSNEATRGRTLRKEDNMELDSVGGAEHRLGEEAGTE